MHWKGKPYNSLLTSQFKKQGSIADNSMMTFSQLLGLPIEGYPFVMQMIVALASLTSLEVSRLHQVDLAIS